MWSQKWDSLIDLIWKDPIPVQNFDNEFIRKHIGPNARVKDLLAWAEDYYRKMGMQN